MKEDIEKIINDFSKGNEDLKKILALFSSQIAVVFSKYLIKKVTTELNEVTNIMLEYYDKK